MLGCTGKSPCLRLMSLCLCVSVVPVCANDTVQLNCNWVDLSFSSVVSLFSLPLSPSPLFGIKFPFFPVPFWHFPFFSCPVLLLPLLLCPSVSLPFLLSFLSSPLFSLAPLLHYVCFLFSGSLVLSSLFTFLDGSDNITPHLILSSCWYRTIWLRLLGEPARKPHHEEVQSPAEKPSLPRWGSAMCRVFCSAFLVGALASAFEDILRLFWPVAPSAATYFPGFRLISSSLHCGHRVSTTTPLTPGQT